MSMRGEAASALEGLTDEGVEPAIIERGGSGSGDGGLSRNTGNAWKGSRRSRSERGGRRRIRPFVELVVGLLFLKHGVILGTWNSSGVLGGTLETRDE